MGEARDSLEEKGRRKGKNTGGKKGTKGFH
jgi:hypothetical protein